MAMPQERTQLELESTVSLKRAKLLDKLSQHVFNNLPAHLICIKDMKLLSRTDLWETLRADIQSLPSADILALQVCTIFWFPKSYHETWIVTTLFFFFRRMSNRESNMPSFRIVGVPTSHHINSSRKVPLP